MIRFNCPNCGRHYELLPALAFLPLVCKQCGERITPPAPEPEPPPPPAPVLQQPAAPPPTPKATLPVAKVVAPPPPVAKPQPPAPPADDADEALATNSDSAPDIDFNLSGPTAADLSNAARALPPDGVNPATASELEGTAGSTSNTQKYTPPEVDLKLLGTEPPPPPPKRAPKPPAPAPEPEVEERPEATLMPFIVDFVVFVLLVVVGMFVGEMLAQKTTGAVLSEAGSAPKFPPPDLLMWGGPPAVFALIYLLLSSRKLSVGEWLRRRRAQ
ncbi:hypothetical protein VT84_36120 [Gemmata sp. SH-PL17]|uniref:hypothetical protein n=1 Tax=Gemmata sp. SH-PL17 TaxID=1630693 RepID=UPI0004BC9AE5|nr:hypothetical protein [Gemmata sp. SH-PL17]AMV29877.1 hypothetical protein VT84_36120 [Gemmata sp. SH-PL17]